jgi:hypothetical protein
MPTTHPRYTVTDTGTTREMLDLAESRWPEVGDRRQLLLRLAALGAQHVAEELADTSASVRRERQHMALRRGKELVDVELLLSDAAWR